MPENRRSEIKVVESPLDPDTESTGARVAHDARGNAIWDWAVATGVLANKTAADLIRMLDVPEDLTLEPEAHTAQRSCDPYNRKARITR